jgi:hypothetical protein
MNKLPSGWQIKYLGEIAENIQYGFTQSSTCKLENLFNTLLQKAFKGELVS